MMCTCTSENLEIPDAQLRISRELSKLCIWLTIGVSTLSPVPRI
jgi:hypothetical protein